MRDITEMRQFAQDVKKALSGDEAAQERVGELDDAADTLSDFVLDLIELYHDCAAKAEESYKHDPNNFLCTCRAAERGRTGTASCR